MFPVFNDGACLRACLYAVHVTCVGDLIDTHFVYVRNIGEVLMHLRLFTSLCVIVVMLWCLLLIHGFALLFAITCGFCAMVSSLM